MLAEPNFVLLVRFARAVVMLSELSNTVTALTLLSAVNKLCARVAKTSVTVKPVVVTLVAAVLVYWVSVKVVLETVILSTVLMAATLAKALAPTSVTVTVAVLKLLILLKAVA